MKEPTIRQLRYFIAVANTGQFSRAARELNISQSALTTAVKQLEAVIGSTLFARTATGVALTQEGNIFLDHARRILTSIEEALRSPARRRDDVRGRIRLAMTYTVAGYYLPPFIEKFTRAFPGVEMQLTEAPRSTIEDGLVSGAFDLAVMLTSNIVDQEGLAYETLMRSRRRLWLSDGHPLVDQANITLGDVSEHPYIMLTVDEASNTAQRYWNKTAYRPNTIFRTSSVEAVRSMVSSGMGVTILSDMVYRPWSLEGRRVEVVPLADNIPTMDVGISWARDVKLNAACMAFTEFMHTGTAT
jgi:DNA-binding transcriptional LysR family regulator